MHASDVPLTDALPLFEHEACVLPGVLLHLGVCVCYVWVAADPACQRSGVRAREKWLKGLFGLSGGLFGFRMSVSKNVRRRIDVYI